MTVYILHGVTLPQGMVRLATSLILIDGRVKIIIIQKADNDYIHCSQVCLFNGMNDLWGLKFGQVESPLHLNLSVRFNISK